MSAYLVFQALEEGKLRKDQRLMVSERAWRTGMTGASRTFVENGKEVLVEDLIKGMIVQSGNDATVVLAEGVAGSVERFVDMMNRQAQRFGLTQTSFRNPVGFTEKGHQSTARELAYIARRLMTDFPASLPYYGMKSFTFNGITQNNRNLLLWRDPSVDGLKTGFTEAAGYCLISTAIRQVPAGHRRLLSVVVGTESPEARANESQKLLNWGYSAFDMVKLFDANQPVIEAKVWKGARNTVPLGQQVPLMVAVPRGQAAALTSRVTRTDPLIAPLMQGQTMGTLQLELRGKPWRMVPLQALLDVPSAGWLGRSWDALRLILE
jgi:serine-type D-Ala-D-Ala carboxypeptidase (penicillin-binding protein 5/6)